METNTLAFFIGIQNLCLNHNKMITSMQWMMGNFFILLTVGLSIGIYSGLLKRTGIRWARSAVIGFWLFCCLFFIGYNAVSLSMPIDEREAMEEVITRKPELAKQVRGEIDQLKHIGKDLR
jgi:hypothetical protein